MRTSLLISTYNWPQALQVVFKSLKEQTVLPDEVLIADDGSKEETKLLIEQFKTEISIPVKHFWQEDNGFRKSKILNKAVAGSDCDYIIQIDGDCIMHRNFIEDHINAAAPNMYLYGARVNILEGAVKEVLENKITSFGFSSKLIKNKTRSLHIPFLAGMYKPHKEYSDKFRGCNVSYRKNDFIAVNGYNESFEGWGREDSDLVIRMGNNGVMAKRLRYAGIVFHIHHKINSRDNFEANDRIQQETIEKKIIRCEKGIDQYL
ncbi:glycosyltransferase family 2 protein [Flavobacterium beibuense]|uniref:Glycosyl transferase, family 2 n=1 Tax=Flavobacterium beibuense TaxID=657326 RepID=A0A444W7F2_9FLAO|nr:glycosyltransferase family 2 protein [Flavobacterium beibuense]RYJ41817.1 Glycosyl transferase, family 2 [Flavobacterium beibuense]